MNNKYPDDVNQAVKELRTAIGGTIEALDDVMEKHYSDDKARTVVRAECDRLRAIIWRITGAILD